MVTCHAVGPPEAAFAPTKPGEVGQALKRGGIDPTTLNLSDPVLLALIAQGATPAEFEGLAREAVAKGIRAPFPWVLKALQGRRADAAAVVLAAPVTAAAAAPDAWAKTRSGVINRGNNLGIAPWSEADAYTKNGPSWAAYQRSVLAADTAAKGRVDTGETA